MHVRKYVHTLMYVCGVVCVYTYAQACVCMFDHRYTLYQDEECTYMLYAYTKANSHDVAQFQFTQLLQGVEYGNMSASFFTLSPF